MEKSLDESPCRTDDWDDGRNPQFLLFANGEVIQGMDINHREVLVRENAKAGEKIQLDLQSYTGTLHSEFRLLADLEEHDAKIEEDLLRPYRSDAGPEPYGRG